MVARFKGALVGERHRQQVIFALHMAVVKVRFLTARLNMALWCNWLACVMVF